MMIINSMKMNNVTPEAIITSSVPIPPSMYEMTATVVYVVLVFPAASETDNVTL